MVFIGIIITQFLVFFILQFHSDFEIINVMKDFTLL